MLKLSKGLKDVMPRYGLATFLARASAETEAGPKETFFFMTVAKVGQPNKCQTLFLSISSMSM